MAVKGFFIRLTAFRSNPMVSRLLADYGILLILVLLCLFFSWATVQEQQSEGEEAAISVVEMIRAEYITNSNLLVVTKNNPKDNEFGNAVIMSLKGEYNILTHVTGEPTAIRRSFQDIDGSGLSIDAIVTLKDYSHIIENIKSPLPSMKEARIIVPAGYTWPTFLLKENLINVVNQIVVIAIIAVGMTMVIITAGIDLSVGSLVAFSAVVVASLIRNWGGLETSTFIMLISSVLAILSCGTVGFFSGLMISRFRIPPFIATLGIMQVASGLAYIISGGESIYSIPNSFVWLGRGTTLLTVPNAVVLMILVYGIAYVLMSHTKLGRYIYAVGGNAEAARLSGVRVNYILIFVYTISGIMAGLGGVVLASQLKSGAPTYGLMYELYVIAAVVVGGTSLSGGEGKVIGTLIGALIIGVIQNGMNLTGVESYTQKVVLGLVILGAVLIDKLRNR